MKKISSILLAALALVLAVSCMQVETKIHLKKDGSGTINLTMAMKKEVLAAMTGSKANIQNPFTKADFIGIAERYGKGVTLVSYEEVKSDTHIGGKALYSFKDINNLKISAVPETDKSQGPEGNGGGEVTFSYNKGYLTIQLNDNEEDKGGSVEEDPAEQEKNAQIMKQLLQDMELNMEITVDGKITSSNATYREGSKITLYKIDFNQILNNDAAFNTFMSNKMDKSALNKVKGVQIEKNKTVDVNFK